MDQVRVNLFLLEKQLSKTKKKKNYFSITEILLNYHNAILQYSKYYC